jgi:radical SAM protein with 4Fe4S-binding SPASM domain
MSDGSVYPCYLLARFEEYKIGNIFKDSLSEILSSPKLEIFKTYDGNICHNKICNYYEECRSGCIAHSIIHYGTHRKPDPRCNLKKEEKR